MKEAKIKKLTTILTLMVVIVLLGGCSGIPTIDDSPAVLEYTTSEGDAGIIYSENGDPLSTVVPERLALQRSNPIAISEDVEVDVHFSCSACECDVVESIHAPFAKLYHCECDGSKNGRREYIALIIYKK